MFSHETQDDVWADNPAALVTGSFMPKGETKMVDGSYRLSGEWGFASACDNADWLYLGAKLATRTDAPATELAFMLVPHVANAAAWTIGTPSAWPAPEVRMLWSRKPSFPSIVCCRFHE